MKKLLLLPVLAFIFTACSTDTEDIIAQHSAERVGGGFEANFNGCFNSLGAHTEIDLSNGFGNGLINFVSEVPEGATGGYKVKVEIEELSDCEDLASGNGNINIFTDGYTYYSVSKNPPSVKGIDPSDTFVCYRWRMVFEGVSKLGKTENCISTTQWYDAPLF
jgi:hypothetical protein